MKPLSFDWDIFISYAHIDNARFTGVEKGWIDHLHERLGICLAQELGRPPKIWRDPEIGNRTIPGAILIELENTAILLAVISPRYLQSSSCRSELDQFLRLAAENGGLQLDGKHRVFKIRNDSVINPITYKPVAYKLQTSPSQMLLMNENSYNSKRAAFATRPIWVTKYQDGELYAAGEFTNQSKKSDGVETTPTHNYQHNIFRKCTFSTITFARILRSDRI